MSQLFETYLQKIERDLRGGKATEHTYRSSLEWLLENLAPGVDASNDPKHIKCGAPDFIVERGKVPLGYVETKDVNDDLAKVEKSEQLKRYRASLNNLILTDYLEFRWYVNGTPKLTARLAQIGKAKRLTPDAEGIATAQRLFDEFYKTEVPTVGTPKELTRMAALTQIVRELLIGALREESETGIFHKQLDAFREHLLPELKPEEFADLYAQTMAYGLFAAAVSRPDNAPFSRAQAYQYLPPANPFLRKMFLDVGEELDGTPIAPFLDDLAALLGRADMPAIREVFGKRTRTEDPVVHFYETFLATYDPKMRASRGVYYTPEPAVLFIVRSIDHLLKTVFNRPLGLADPNTLLLDPATGTATFLYIVIRIIHDTLVARGQAGTWQEYVREKLLPRIFGFELLMAPYAVAHLKLGLLLAELGHTFGKHERLGVFLTNTLEESITKAETLGLAGYLSEEGSAAAEVKNRKPIMVVLGNPPYSGHSANKSEWISNLVRDYYFVDGAPLGERNPKWLQDDYVKFIRFAQWRIAQTGHGVVGFITNHGYLDNPTFRGMRQNLMATFDDIYVLDLHGNSKKREVAPDGGKDENVFDIQQGVAILLAVRRGGVTPPDNAGDMTSPLQRARVHHADLWGLRADKYKFLEGNAVDETQWKDLQPTAPFYLFVPQDQDVREEYERGWKITDAIPTNLMGFQTHRDEVAVGWNPTLLQKQVSGYLKRKPTKAEWEQYFAQCSYRPFDNRFVFLDNSVSDRSRFEIMRHLFKPNLALAIGKQGQAVGEGEWSVLFCSSSPVDANIYRRGGANIFPLYLYTTPDDTAGTLFAQNETTRTANLAPAFVQAFSATLGLEFVPDGKGDIVRASRRLAPTTFGPEDIFNYAYAVFHCPTYRTRYAEFLKIDFPRLPLTSDAKLFAKLAAKGAELVALHLLKSPALDEFITTFRVAGDNAVEKVEYAGKKVWINKEQYFGGVPESVWEFKVGGYQVCDKWLKDRKGRQLSGDDVTHYQRVVVALKETIRLMQEIDKAMPGFPLE